MASLVFIQNSRVGTSIFQVHGDKLEISPSRLGRREKMRVVSLRTVSSAYGRFAQRFPRMFLVPLSLCLPCIGLTFLILRQEILPHVLVVYPGGMVAGFLVLAIRGYPKVEFFQFYDHWKRPLFYVVRESKSAEECDIFVQDLLERIGKIESDQPIDLGSIKVEPICSVTLPAIDDSLFLGDGESRWKAAVLFGLTATGLTQVPEITFFLGGLEVLLTVAAAMGGALFCIYSFMANERFRFISLLGGVLSLLAPFLM